MTIKDPVCPPGTSYQSAQGKCICDNPMQILRSNGCACPTNSIPDGPTKCICDNKSISICANGSCDKCSQCWVNSSPINNKCVCNTGYTQSSSFTCTAFVTTQCVIGASYDTITGKCLCNIVSQIITSTGCVCPIMMTLNSANMCVCDTKDGYSLSPNGGGCVLTSSLVVCGKNTEFVNGVCQCNSLSVPINKICTICWANSTPGSHNSVCNCN